MHLGTDKNQPRNISNSLAMLPNYQIASQFIRRIVKSALPNDIVRLVQARNAASQFRSKGVVFIHVPKAAGASINEVLYGKLIGHFSVQQLLLVSSRDIKALPRFCLVRNPWSRLFSAYRFAVNGVGTGGITAGISNRAVYSSTDFSTFETFVLNWLPKQNLRDVDVIFRPQVSFVCVKGCTPQVDHVGRVERLEETLLWLQEHTQCKVKTIPISNASPQSVDYRNAYNDKMIETASAIYNDDIKAFGYQFES